MNNFFLFFCLIFLGHISTSRGGGTYSAALSGVSSYRSGAHLTHVFYPVSRGHRGAGYLEGGASVRSCAADDGGYVPIREEHQNVKRVNGEFWLTAFAAKRVPRWQLLAYLDNPCKEKPPRGLKKGDGVGFFTAFRPVYTQVGGRSPARYASAQGGARFRCAGR